LNFLPNGAQDLVLSVFSYTMLFRASYKPRLEGAIHLLVTFFISACTIWATRNALYTESSDLGGHYIATEYISRFRAWPPALGSVRPADDYPLLAHTMAALVGGVFRSNLRALLTLSVLSVCAIYGLLAWGTRRSGQSGWLFSICAGALMILLAPLNIFWGDEVIHNFFYAHVVGEAVFLAFLLLISTLQTRVAQALLACLGTAMLSSIYTLSAVHLAFSCPLLWALPIFDQSRRSRRLPVKQVASIGLLFVLLCAVVMSNSMFFSMVRNAAHGARIDLLGDLGFVGIIAGNVFLFAALVALSVNTRCRFVNPSFVLAALGGVTGAAAVQWISWSVLGYGSPYALSKHTFALGSMFVIAFVAVILDLPVRSIKFTNPPSPAPSNSRPIKAALAPSIFSALALLSLWWTHPKLDLRDVELFESDARQLTSGELAESVLGHTVAYNSLFPAGVNFTIAKVALGLSGYTQIEQVKIYEGRLNPGDQTADYFLVSSYQMQELDPDCEIRTSPRLQVSRLARASCYAQLR
jgi:hypothetical protein